MDLLCVKLDLWPAGGAEHFLPDESDVLKTGRDLLIIQLQPPALEVALRGCSHTHAHTHTHIMNTWIKPSYCDIQKQIDEIMPLMSVQVRLS